MNKTTQQYGNKNSQSEKYNNSCFIINNFSDGLIFGISGLIPFNEAIRRTNDHNLNKKQLYNLYINKDIKHLVAIKFGEYFKDLSINPSGREKLTCLNTKDITDIKLVINNSNFKEFTDMNIVKEKYPNLLINSSKPFLGLTDENNKILNKYIYNNMFKNMSKKKIFAFLLNNNNAVANKIIDNNFSTKKYCSRNINSNSNKIYLN